MSSTQGRGRARLYKPCGPLRKCGEFREPEIENVSQDDEKPPVQKLQQTVSEAGKSGTLQLAQGCQPSPNKNEQILSDWMQFEDYYHENLIEDGSTASSVNLDNDIDDDDNTEAGSMFGDEDDMTLQSEPTETVKKKCKQLKKCIDIKDADIVKFISNRSKYSQELGSKLEKLNAEVELVPEKNLIIVTKKPRSRYIKDWKKRCCSIVRKFCSRFRKNCFELKDSSSVRKALPRFGKMLQWSTAMYWIESNKILAVMTEQSECEQVLKKVKEFLENDGIQEYKSDEDKRKEPSNVTKVAGMKNLKQRQKSVYIDGDIANFLLKRSKCSEDLKGQLSCLGAELQILKSGSIEIKEVNGKAIPNWEERCEKAVNVFCGRFHKKYFVLENEIRDSIPEALSTLQKDVSSTGGACWLDKHKQNLILVSPKDGFTNAEKEVQQFFENIRRFAKRRFQVKESIHELVRKDLPTLKEALKSCNITLKKKTLVVDCLRNEVDCVTEKVESFLQRLEGVKLDGNLCPFKATTRSKTHNFLQNLREENEKPKEVVKFVNISHDHVDFIERTQFLNTLKQCHPEMVEVSITEAKNEICFMGSNEAILVAEQQYADLVKELNVIELQLPPEVMQLVTQKEGLEFVNNSLSNRESVYVIVVGAGSVKVVAQSPQVCKEVKECLCKNVRKATITLPPQSEHIFASKQWYEIFKTIETESLVDYEINFVQKMRHDIKLHGATPLVDTYEKIITDLIHSQKVEFYEIRVASGTARLMKEKLSEEISKIESDLKEEQVKINILPERTTCEFKGTKEGIRESKRRVLALSDQITTKVKDYSRTGICTLFFSENGKRNIKGIEAGSNAIIEISKEPITMEKESTQAEVKAIRGERAQEKSKVRQAPSRDPFDQCNFTTNEGLQVSWKYGNIAQERADILVSSANRNLTNPTVVGRVMNLVGGPSFVAACCQHTDIGTGEIATTIGGNLLCQYVIHAVCCDWNSNGVAEQTLRGLLLKILRECTRLSAISVAIPLIGTGKRKFPEDFVLRVMTEEFVKFSSMYSSSTLKEIKLIRYDPSGRRTAAQAPPRSGSVFQVATLSNESTDTFVPLVAGSSTEKLKLQVFARSSIHVSSAFDEIEKFIQNHLTSKTLNHEKHYDVVLNHWNELKLLTKDHDLKITCVDLTTVLLVGVLSKVVEAKDKLAKLASQYTNEERKSNQLSYIARNVQWYYDDLLSSREVPYSAQLNGTIELARMNDEATVEIIEPDGQKYVVDFSQMVAKNTSFGSYLLNFPAGYQYARGGQTKKLTRKLIGSAANPGTESSLPSRWSPQPENQLVQMVPIASSSQEYLEVRNHFVARGGDARLLCKVERIQNPQLYRRYLAFKNTMGGPSNEMRLFHGTDAANVDSINARNFSRSFAGVNGVAYGNGVYFARDASYSMRYANHQPSGSQPKMYMAKVLVGEYTRGAQGMKAPPSKNDPKNPGQCYDSVVDHPSNPSKYIIFQDNQYYPEYLLTMR